MGKNTKETKLIAVLCILLAFLTFASSLECYKCSSAIDKDCATNPGQQIEVEECIANDTECVTTIINGATHRGCPSRVIPSGVCGNLCEKCTLPLCNNEIFPENRLKCYQCSGAGCVDISASNLSPLACPVYVEKDRCSTNVVSENNVIRDCTSSFKEEICKNICLKCNYDGCNIEPGVTNHTCIQCVAPNRDEPNHSCRRFQEISADGICEVGVNISTCTSKILHGHKGKCFTYEDYDTVHRGCSSNMGFYPTGRVWECYGESCNNECLDMKCIVCDSSNDTRCRDSPSLLKAEKCPVGTVSCFSCENGNILTRGCGTSSILNQNPCYNCFGKDGCNNENIRTCHRCTSTQDENCATWENITGIKKEICSHSQELCVTTVVQKFTKTYTARGCEGTVVECTEGDPFCERCDGSLCNDGTVSLDLRLAKRKNIALAWSSSGISRILGKLSYIVLTLVLVIKA